MSGKSRSLVFLFQKMNLGWVFEHNFGPGREGGFKGNNQEFNLPRGGKLNLRIDRRRVWNLLQYLLKSTLIEFRFSKKHQRRLSPINKALCLEYIVKGKCTRSRRWYVRNHPQQTSRSHTWLTICLVHSPHEKELENKLKLKREINHWNNKFGFLLETRTFQILKLIDTTVFDTK